MNGADVRLVILDILEECQPYALREETVLRQLNARVKPPVEEMVFDEHLLFLKKEKFIEAEKGPAGAIKPEWKITRKGRGERLA